MNKRIYLGLGSNQGNRHKNLIDAATHISNRCGIIVQESSIYETAAWGKEDQPSFFNQILELESELSAEMLLEACLSIENDMGRIRKEKWGARLIDIDILYFNTQTRSSSELIIPHPAIPQRRFVLLPLCEIARDFVHPNLKKTQEELLNECSDTLEVKQINF